MREWMLMLGDKGGLLSGDEEVMLVALDNCWVGFDLVGFCVLDDRRGG